ncbi:hypothetical protein Ae201684P_005296 [Aphanomyces euteiches]|nr:hypothetical protein Ae201684P_005296 [Aphanomyces euteiches]
MVHYDRWRSCRLLYRRLSSCIHDDTEKRVEKTIFARTPLDEIPYAAESKSQRPDNDSNHSANSSTTFQPT